jgi:glycosyltransferase involved in cell wall biosynthesis
MTSVCIGVHVHAEPERLLATLVSLRTNTALTADVVLLPDGPDPPTTAALATLKDLPQLCGAEPRGPAACFNRMAASRPADLFVLIESGAQVGPRWLEHLMAALAADPWHGLAGPSTNRSWNEQCVFRQAGLKPLARHDSLSEINRAAQDLERRFGAMWKTLEPLHSLADFCYTVRREVVEAIGAADEGYGLGPCWEMDYNIRAARSGFRGVWACAAYVHRAPFTARRAREEVRRFEASKHRYQDKFCALKLRHERAGFEPHCRGEACEYFAPTQLIELRLPLRAAPAQMGREPLIEMKTPRPLVSCIMPTRDRRDFVRQSVRYFQRQDFPTLELIILDDGRIDLSAELNDDSRIRYLRLPGAMSIGAKRNHGCEVARGSVIAHWDDDDWYAPHRLSAQVETILSGDFDICGLSAGVFFDLARWEFWRCTPDLHRRMFIGDVHGGTLVFKRRVWEHGARYPDLSLAEDAWFLQRAMQCGARLRRLAGEGSFVYLRHSGSSWQLTCGQFIDPRGWQRVPEPPLPPEDRAFYAALSTVAAVPVNPATTSGPLVSCIMPTANRRLFVPQAIRYFLRQDYANRELLILDDGTDAVADLVPPDPRIRYVRLAERGSVGAKRNMACELARGELIIHWDDDDWMADRRLSYQVRELLRHPVMTLSGLSHLLFQDPQAGQAWEYTYPATQRPWVCGNTFCYRKRLWEQHGFPDLNEGEDAVFVRHLKDAEIVALPDHTFYIATLHAHNTSRKKTHGALWRSFPMEKVRRLLNLDWEFYATLSQS